MFQRPQRNGKLSFIFLFYFFFKVLKTDSKFAFAWQTENIIESLQNLIKARYQALDEKLLSVISEFDKELDFARTLEQGCNSENAMENVSGFSHLQPFCFFLFAPILSFAALSAFLAITFFSESL